MSPSPTSPMTLKSLVLRNFRSYASSKFSLNEGIVSIVGKNATGKTNLIEAIYLLGRGKSFRAEKDTQMIQLGKEVGRVQGEVYDTKLEVVLVDPSLQNLGKRSKKFLVNGVSKRGVDFVGNLAVVLFAPTDLEIMSGSPGTRRRFLDETLQQVDREYRLALMEYTKALKQRNALLERVQETGVRNAKLFEYWDDLLIKQGEVIAEKREAFCAFLNNSEKSVFDFAVTYDKSVISRKRLEEYKSAEEGAGVTLVGPHRDDIILRMFNRGTGVACELRFFGSRGQQRLSVLQLKLLELLYVEKALHDAPVLLLDDIFSELDASHIKLVLETLPHKQIILTTTHKEFLKGPMIKNAQVIEIS